MPHRSLLFLLSLLLLSWPLFAATLPALNSNWKYQLGTAEASLPDTTAWRGKNFNDTSWLSAPAPFRMAVGSGGTQLAMQNNYTSIFLRQSFSLTANDIAAIPQLMLNVDFDDGFIVWINGVEV